MSHKTSRGRIARGSGIAAVYTVGVFCLASKGLFTGAAGAAERGISLSCAIRESSCS